MWQWLLKEIAKTALVNVILPVLTKYAQHFEATAEDALKALKSDDNKPEF